MKKRQLFAPAIPNWYWGRTDKEKANGAWGGPIRPPLSAPEHGPLISVTGTFSDWYLIRINILVFRKKSYITGVLFESEHIQEE